MKHLSVRVWGYAVTGRERGILIDFHNTIWTWNDSPPYDGTDYEVKQFERNGKSICYGRAH